MIRVHENQVYPLTFLGGLLSEHDCKFGSDIAAFESAAARIVDETAVA